ncbi:hypothetical protein SSPSH_002926 [Salinisphaera shabanensis E1L3A]|jgi:hypothetical protein|uniref:Uncharacterized protein n=1 Tax=Salinisphaera shabanensis E1L3A TaxID=1033802 RepID=U2FPS0_9GAMM|nr:hypothetical protein [Salinisphaera shabanensis]ERJ18149.1 hypothetical protein SSPSH_002926 [Salinisphaera shabanensis E1L3A]
MAKAPESYSFNPFEILTLMVKEADIHEGKWMLKLDFDVKGGNFAIEGEDPTPGTVVMVKSLTLARDDDDSDAPLSVDAAEINPRS